MYCKLHQNTVTEGIQCPSSPCCIPMESPTSSVTNRIDIVMFDAGVRRKQSGPFTRGDAVIR